MKKDNARRDCRYCHRVYEQGFSGYVCSNKEVSKHFYDLPCSEDCEGYLGWTCQNISDPPEGFLCSACGWGDFAEPSHILTSSHYSGLEKGPRYCPNCGSKVMSCLPNS